MRIKSLRTSLPGAFYPIEYNMNIEYHHSLRKWFTDGPSLGHKGWGANIYWLINLALYALMNIYYLRIRTGELLMLAGPFKQETLIPGLLAPLNVFQFPSFILITAFIMAMLCIIPMITAQLYNFLYAVPFLFAAFFLGHMPVLTIALLISCVFISMEPFRFKSKFVAAVMCFIPIFLYWIFRSGSNTEKDVLRWAVLYAPWALSFLTGISLYGIILAIGHFVRYRPVIILPVFGLMLAGTVYLFHGSIGMPERDFQAAVVRYSPKNLPEFQPRSIASQLEKELKTYRIKMPFISEDLIASTLRFQWLEVFNEDGTSINNHSPGYDETDPASIAKKTAADLIKTRIDAMEHIEAFIEKYPNDPRVADALYYLGMLYDLKVNLPALRDEDMLRFNSHVPSPYTHYIWEDLRERFGNTDVAIEARYRLARLASQNVPEKPTQPYLFDEAFEMLNQAYQQLTVSLERRLSEEKKKSFWHKRLGSIFTPPPPSISDSELLDLRNRIGDLRLLLSKENRTGHLKQNRRLAEFIGMSSNQLNYEARLKVLLIDSQPGDPLRDNIEFKLLTLNKNRNDRIAGMAELIRQYPESDGAARARLSLARLMLEDSKTSEHISDRHLLLQQSRDYLQQLIANRPSTYLALQAHKLLDENPLQ